MNGWRVERLSGAAADLHARDAFAGEGRVVSVLEATRPALVLGSTQRDDIVDLAALAPRGAELAHRQTGGGAVFLAPGDAVWIDVVIPPNDRLWSDDVAAAFDWLGRAWVAALHDVGLEDAVVNRTAACQSVLGRLICFAGLGFGEVSSDEGKIVGLSQRRTRTGAWFQCVVMRRWDTVPYVQLLAPGLERLATDPESELASFRVKPVDVEPRRLVDAFLARLPV